MVQDVEIHRPFNAYQAFLLACKREWTSTLTPLLKEEYDARRAAGARPRTAADVEAMMADSTLARFFGWTERHLQKMKYSGRLGLIPDAVRRREELRALLAVPTDDRILELDPDFRQPDYFTAVDIHQHPGGVWSDELAGLVYERGARSTTPTLARDADLHDRFTTEVMARKPDARSLVDMGCGFGKSTRPFYTGRREMEVVGVDLAEPCLRLAAATAIEDQARNVRFRQADAARTGLPDASADVVTSTMMLHEMPPRHIESVIGESYRLLQPGGLAIHLDFLSADDPFLRYLHYGHARRNNEPYMPPLNEMGIEDAHRRAGFKDVEVVPFAEREGALAPDNTGWRFPWVMVIARKPA